MHPCALGMECIEQLGRSQELETASEILVGPVDSELGNGDIAAYSIPVDDTTKLSGMPLD